jgi:pimeloyl-ACP methyl ester carboxylesterase
MAYISVFRSKSGEQQVFEAYDSMMKVWPVPYEDRYVETKLGITHVIVSGPPTASPIVLIHAYYASAASWYRNAGQLSEHYRVYNIDVIGDPNKSKPCKPIRKAEEFIQWLNEVMDKLHLEKAVFIGNSVGAFHILNFAMHLPDRVRKIVLIGPAATFMKIPSFYYHTFPGGMTGWPFLVRHAIGWIENGAPLDPPFKRLFYLMMRYGKSANQVFPFVFGDNQLEKVNIPTLLLYGDNECIYNIDLAAKRATQLMKNIKVKVIPGANHLTAVSNPEATNNAILDFLKEPNN